ncbi:hypothetical protein LCGC14_1204520 [marine sediment metagenome]|uniref:Radical SAM core domain-containing protein n=1 Tax=marine sediment metagenome TaxID=412755 RepID=A0A0F9NYA9_9ZZZZ
MPIYDKSNLACNFGCEYCYQHPIRPKESEIDRPAVERSIKAEFDKKYTKGWKEGERQYCRVGLHGGEPLYQDRKHIERGLQRGFEYDGRSAIQTNGYLIDDEIIGWFKKYKTGVGLSVDGPWPCNELRGFGTVKERKKQTLRVHRNLNRLVDAGGKPSVIAVIHKSNGTGDRIEIMKHWLLELHQKGIQGRLNPCMSGNPKIDLTQEETLHFYSEMYDFMLENGIDGFSPFKDIVNSLSDGERVVCVFKDCDPFYTVSCTTVLKDGAVGVCIKNYMNDEKIYLRDNRSYDLRARLLEQTDCKGCPWWENCRGGCPAQAIDFDWRNKDRYCEMYKMVFERISSANRFLKPYGPRKNKKNPSGKKGRVDSKDYWDGIDHYDGDTHYIDSDNPSPGD